MFFREGTNTTMFIDLLTSADVKMGPYAASFPCLVGSPSPLQHDGVASLSSEKYNVFSNFL